MEKPRNKIPTRKRSNLKRLEALAQLKQKENSNSDPGTSAPVFASVNPRPRRSSLSALKREQLIQQQQQNHRHHSQQQQQQHLYHQYHSSHSNDLSHQLQVTQSNNSQLQPHQQQQQQHPNRELLPNASNSSFNFVYVTQSSANATAAIASVGHPLDCMPQSCISNKELQTPITAPITTKPASENNSSITDIVKQSFGFWRGSNNHSNNSNHHNTTNNSSSNAIKCNEQETAPTKGGASMMLCPIPQPFRQHQSNNNQSTNWMSSSNQQQQKNSNNIKSSSITNDCDYPNESGGIFFIQQQNQHFKQNPTPPPPSLQNAINTNTNHHHQSHNNHHHNHLQNHNHHQNNQIPTSSVNGSYHQTNNSKIPLGSAGQQQPPHSQNFHQISKTATNLLAEIYEKHLLNQTTFENVALLNAHSRNDGQIPLGLTVTKNSAAFITAVQGSNDENNSTHQSTIIQSMNHSASNSSGLSRLASATATTTVMDDEFSLSSLEHKQQTVRMHVSGYPQPQIPYQQHPQQVINYQHQLQLQFQPQDQQLHASFRPPPTASCNHTMPQQHKNYNHDQSNQMCQRTLINQVNHLQNQNNFTTLYPTPYQQILQGHITNNKDDLTDRCSSPYSHLYEVVPEHPPLPSQNTLPPLQPSHPTRSTNTNRVLRKRSSSKSQKNQNKESNKNSFVNMPVNSNALDSVENKQTHSSNQKGKNMSNSVSGNEANNFGNSGGINCCLVQKPPPIPNLPPPPNIPPPEMPIVNGVAQCSIMQRTNADGEQHPHKMQTTENYKNSHSSHSKQLNQKEKIQKQSALPPLISSLSSTQSQQHQQQKLQPTDNDEQQQQQKQKQQHNNLPHGHDAKNSNSSSSVSNNNNKSKNDGGIPNIRGIPNGSSYTTIINKDNNSCSLNSTTAISKNPKGNSNSITNYSPSTVVDEISNNNNSGVIQSTENSLAIECGKEYQHQIQSQHLIIQYAQQQQQQKQQQQQQQLSAGIILSPDQQKLQGANNIISSVGTCLAIPTATTAPPPPTAANAILDITQKCNYDELNNYSSETLNGIAKFFYRNSKIDLSEETAQVMAAAAYYATSK